MSQQHLQKAFRANLKGVTLPQHEDMEDFCAACEELLVDVAHIGNSVRVTSGLLKKAVQAEFPSAGRMEQAALARAIYEGLQFCKLKQRQMTSGKKLHPAVLKICKALHGSRGSLPEEKSPEEKSKASVTDGSAPTLPAGSFEHELQTLASVYGLPSSSGASSSWMPACGMASGPIEVQGSQELETIPSSAEEPKQEDPKSQEARTPAAWCEDPKGPKDFKHMWVDKAELQVCATLVSGETMTAKLQEGPAGFCQGLLGSCLVDTEVPNLLLGPVDTAKKACIRKRPAKAQDVKEEEEEEEEEEQQE